MANENEAKEKCFQIIEQVKVLNDKKAICGLSEAEDLTLRNLEVKLMNAWSDWKDPE